MGRPSASEANKSLALAFANLVSRQTDNFDDIIARCGRCSLFAVFRTCCPTFIREENFGQRDGISEVEFNKVLQGAGFQRVRNRRTGASNRESDPLGAGLYVFSNCRWKDPSVANDAAVLVAGYHEMVECFPDFGRAVQLDRFLATLRAIVSQWDHRLVKRTRRIKRSSRHHTQAKCSRRTDPVPATTPAKQPAVTQPNAPSHNNPCEKDLKHDLPSARESKAVSSDSEDQRTSSNAADSSDFDHDNDHDFDDHDYYTSSRPFEPSSPEPGAADGIADVVDTIVPPYFPADFSLCHDGYYGAPAQPFALSALGY